MIISLMKSKTISEQGPPLTIKDMAEWPSVDCGALGEDRFIEGYLSSG